MRVGRVAALSMRSLSGRVLCTQTCAYLFLPNSTSHVPELGKGEWQVNELKNATTNEWGAVPGPALRVLTRP